jgi:Domain of unknown function (DUF6908)
MKTILQILEAAGGPQGVKHISIENSPWMRLVIEVLAEPGPNGHVVVSVAHYGEQNSDPMRDPEMLFEVVQDEGGQPQLWPFYFRNDYAGVEQWGRYTTESGEFICLPKRTREMEEFAKIWDQNLTEQGFLEAYHGRADCELSADGGR